MIIRSSHALVLAAAGLAAAAVPAFPQVGPAARIAAVVGDGSLPGAAVPPLGAAAVPEAPPSAPVLTAAPPSAPGSVVPADLWAKLSAPDAATLAWLSSRVPGLDAGSVRTVTADAVDAMFDAAVARNQSPLDFFTDPGFRGTQAYYLPPDVIAQVFGRYDIHVVTPPAGTTKDGRPFAMQALLVGGGRVDALYDLDQFDMDNPLFPGYTYKVAARVTERIQGPGDLLVEGLWVHAGIVTPRIQRIVKTSPTEGRVETNYGSRVKEVAPLKRR